MPAECIRYDERRAHQLLAALDPARSSEDAFGHALLAQLYLDGDGRDPDDERRATARIQAEWQSARRRWPDDVGIAWQAVRQCAAAYGCDEAAAERHLVELDADNTAAWLQAMEGAARRNERARYEDELAHAARASRYAPPAGALRRVLEPLFAAAPTPPYCLSQRGIERRAARLGHPPSGDDLAQEEAALFEEALNTFDPSSAIGGCVGAFGIPVPGRRRAPCVTVLAKVAGGATLTERATALPALILLLGDSPASLAQRERYRQLLFLQDFATRARYENRLSDAALPSDGFEDWRRLAVARDRWPPPENWLPEWPVTRALVLEGKDLRWLPRD